MKFWIVLNLHIKVCGLMKDDKHSLSELVDGDTLESYKINKKSNMFLFALLE